MANWPTPTFVAWFGTENCYLAMAAMRPDPPGCEAQGGPGLVICGGSCGAADDQLTNAWRCRPVAVIRQTMRRVASKPERRRALELLAASPDGCTEAIMLAHGFPVPLLVDLCIAGLAIATPARIVSGGRPVEVVRMKITEAGRKAIKQARPLGR